MSNIETLYLLSILMLSINTFPKVPPFCCCAADRSMAGKHYTSVYVFFLSLLLSMFCCVCLFSQSIPYCDILFSYSTLHESLISQMSGRYRTHNFCFKRLLDICAVCYTEHFSEGNISRISGLFCGLLNIFPGHPLKTIQNTEEKNDKNQRWRRQKKRVREKICNTYVQHHGTVC